MDVPGVSGLGFLWNFFCGRASTVGTERRAGEPSSPFEFCVCVLSLVPAAQEAETPVSQAPSRALRNPRVILVLT
eukprot:5834227-Pyramimonas_sp.AAC.1